MRPVLMKAAAAMAIQKAERALGVCAHDSARVLRERFRELTALAQPGSWAGSRAAGRDDDGSQGSESGDSNTAEYQGYVHRRMR